MKSLDKKNLLKAVKTDKTAYIGLADIYEEEGNLQEAARARHKAGISEVVYKVFRKSDNKMLKKYTTLGGAASFINSRSKGGRELTNYEVRMYELRYIDVGIVVPQSQKSILENITIKDDRPFIRDVDLCETIEGMQDYYWNDYAKAREAFTKKNLTKKEINAAIDFFRRYGIIHSPYY